ncbi:MAG: glycosyltransferase family 39 protein [Phycisphaerae bacterium]
MDTRTISSRAGSLRWCLSAVLIVTFIGAGFRFYGLGDRDFWFDESCTFIYVHNLFDWPAGSNLLVESTNLPYYAALRAWTSVFGETEVGYRSCSALLATLTVPLLGLAAGRLGGRMSGVVCAAIVAFNPLHIHYAREARAYAMWMFVLSGSIVLLVEAQRRLRWTWWFWYGAAAFVCLHVHYCTIYWLPATAIILLHAQDRRRAFRQWLTTHVAVAILFIPYFLSAVLPAGRGGGSGWLDSGWEAGTAIVRSLWAFLPAGGYPAHLRGLSILSPDSVKLGPEWLTVVARTMPAVVIVTAAACLLRRRLRSPAGAPALEGRARAHIIAAGMTIVPLILGWLYSLIVRPNYLVGRYDLVAWPACMVWLALIASSVTAIGQGRHSVYRTIVICGPMLACSLVPIARMAALKPPPTFAHRRAQRLAQLAGPNDLAVTFSYDRDYLLYYLHRAGFAAQVAAFPSWLSLQVGWVDLEPNLTADRVALLRQEAAALAQEAEALIARGGHVWLLPDSHQYRTDARGRLMRWPRAKVNRFLLEALREKGLRKHTLDEELLISRLER